MKQYNENGQIYSASKLSPDLNFPANKLSGQSISIFETGFNTTASLTQVVNLQEAGTVLALSLSALTANDLEHIKLTIDSVVVWDTAITSNVATENYIGDVFSNSYEFIKFENSFVFEVKCTTDTSIDCRYIYRKTAS